VSGRRVLVTGAAGFLGRHLCRRLAQAGAEVHAVSRRIGVHDGDAHRWWSADLEHEQDARELVRAVKPTTVFHFGGLTHAAPDLRLVLPTFHSLLTSTVNVLTVLAELGCERIVLVGSPEEPALAGSEVAPASPYGRMFHALYATPVVIARLYMTYGPGQAARKVIPYTILSLLRGERPLLSSGTRQWDFVYVDDAIEGLLRAADVPGLEGATIDIGSGRAVALRAVVEELVHMIAPTIEPTFGAVPDRPCSDGGAADAVTSETRLGWRATTPLQTGLRRTIEWYRTAEGVEP
jgi:nucleoside-diphosphate-sugar epimerase